MLARMCSRVRLAAIASLLSLFAGASWSPRVQAAPPSPHHSGQWTDATAWPGRDYSAANGVQAIHMALIRGDTLFARPHSQVLAWEHWSESSPNTGGVWGWRPLYDNPSQVLSNLSAITIPQPPPYDLYCGGHAALPDGDLLVMSGTERGKTGKDQSARFDAMTLSWLPRSMNGRRW